MKSSRYLNHINFHDKEMNWLQIRFLISARIWEIPAQWTGPTTIRGHQTNDHIHRDYIQFHGIAEHDPCADGGGERMWGQRIPANRITAKLPEQCDILLYESGDWVHNIRSDAHLSLRLSTASSYLQYLADHIAVPVSFVSDCVHIFADGCLWLR